MAAVDAALDALSREIFWHPLPLQALLWVQVQREAELAACKTLASAIIHVF